MYIIPILCDWCTTRKVCLLSFIVLYNKMILYDINVYSPMYFHKWDQIYMCHYTNPITEGGEDRQ